MLGIGSVPRVCWLLEGVPIVGGAGYAFFLLLALTKHVQVLLYCTLLLFFFFTICRVTPQSDYDTEMT